MIAYQAVCDDGRKTIYDLSTPIAQKNQDFLPDMGYGKKARQNSPAGRAKEQTIALQSCDGELTLTEEHRRVDDVMTAFFSVTKKDELIYDCPDSYRVWDYHGTFWGIDSYDFWTLSGDLGMCCYVYGDGIWQKGWLFTYKADGWDVTVNGTIKTIPLRSIPPEVIAYAER